MFKIQYESGGARSTATDIICPMYMRPRWCEEQSLQDSRKRPVVLCEYAHAMGNSGGSLAAYWQRFRDPKYPRLQGGFIWDFVDQGLLLPNQGRTGAGGDERGQGGNWNRPAYGYGGDFGDLPNTKQFCCNGIAGPGRELFPTAYEAAHLQSPVEITMLFNHRREPVLIVSNRRSFADLSDLTVRVTPWYHGETLGAHAKYASFDLLCGPIVAGGFQKFDILEQLKISLCPVRKSSAFSHEPMAMDAAAACGAITGGVTGCSPETLRSSAFEKLSTAEAWLDMSVTALPGSYTWHPAVFEVMHTALASPALVVTMQRLLSGKYDNHRSNSLSDGIFNTSSSSSTVPAAAAADATCAPDRMTRSSTGDISTSSAYTSPATSPYPRPSSTTSSSTPFASLMVETIDSVDSSGKTNPAEARQATVTGCSSLPLNPAAPAVGGVLHRDDLFVQVFELQEEEEEEIDGNGERAQPGLHVRWSDEAVAKIGKKCGRLLSWHDQHCNQLLAAPIDGCLYRAGTDNDRGGMILSYYARWKEVGLDRLQRRMQRDAVVSQRRLQCGAVEVVTNWIWDSPADAAIPISIPCTGRYVFHTSGSIDVAFTAAARCLRSCSRCATSAWAHTRRIRTDKRAPTWEFSRPLRRICTHTTPSRRTVVGGPTRGEEFCHFVS